MKAIAKSLIQFSTFPIELQEKLLFLGKCRYWPNFDQPRSFNEKVNWRKLHSNNELYVTCGDKLAVRELVRKRIGEEYLIPILYQGKSISEAELLSLGNNIVVKATHDSGSAVIIRENTPERSREACGIIERKLRRNFGARSREWWYAKVPPRVYVEKFIEGPEGQVPYDVKFFVFNQKEGKPPRTIIEVDFFRGSRRHHRTYYDQDGEIILMDGRGIEIEGAPNLRAPFPCPDQLDRMREIAFRLAEGFDHIRVDLYQSQGRIYFGELTLSDGGGRSRWSPREFDFRLGEYWNLDQSPGGSECPRSQVEKVRQNVERPDPVRQAKRRIVSRLKRIRNWFGVMIGMTARCFALPYLAFTQTDPEECPKGRLQVFFDLLYLFFRFHYLPINYRQCRLYEKPRSEWKYYYGGGYDPLAIARRNRKVRNPECAVLFEDKEISHALCRAHDFPLPYQYGVVNPDDDLPRVLGSLFESEGAKRVFIKPAGGDSGLGVCVAETDDSGIVIRQATEPSIKVPADRFALNERCVMQEAVVQHAELSAIFPRSLNTLRIVTLATPEGDVRVVGSLLRFGSGSRIIDNGRPHGLTAFVHPDSGRLNSFAIDRAGRRITHHPDTGVAFPDCRIPFWDEVQELACRVQTAFVSFNRFLGLDIAIGVDGPLLVEVNDIFGGAHFESAAGPLLADEEIRRCLMEYEMVPARRFR